MNISDNFVALFIFGGAFMIPIVAILVAHQQKMAALFRNQSSQNDNEAINRMNAEMQDLRSLLAQQAIVLDNLSESQRKVLSALQANSLSDRISS